MKALAAIAFVLGVGAGLALVASGGHHFVTECMAYPRADNLTLGCAGSAVLVCFVGLALAAIGVFIFAVTKRG